MAVCAAWFSTQRSQAEPCLSVPPGCVNQWQALAAAADGHRPGLWHMSPLVPAAA